MTVAMSVTMLAMDGAKLDARAVMKSWREIRMDLKEPYERVLVDADVKFHGVEFQESLARPG